MKRIAPYIFSVVLLGLGATVGWELKNWHVLFSEWQAKSAAYDFVGADVMGRVMIEISKQRIQLQRQQQQKLEVKQQPLPTYPPLQRGQVAA